MLLGFPRMITSSAVVQNIYFYSDSEKPFIAENQLEVIPKVSKRP